MVYLLLEECLSLIATGSGDAENAEQSSDIIVINNTCISKVSLTYFKEGCWKGSFFENEGTSSGMQIGTERNMSKNLASSA